MLENIGNTITRLAMDLLGRNLAGRIPSRSRHVRQNLDNSDSHVIKY